MVINMKEYKTQRTKGFNGLQREYAVITVNGKVVLLIERIYRDGELTYENNVEPSSSTKTFFERLS